ncbi:MAG: RluA family pseudouridine synthase [Bacilli bacterium]|jgi:23S rRNA pseudouridine1911/1915/1917 synthase|nr:RluA family pseudouridine synthase [Bacilli bacterium]
MEKIVVHKEDNKKRLDKYLSDNYQDLSRTIIQKMIEDNAILVNDEIVKANYKLKSNDIISIEEYVKPDIKLEPENIALDIIYEDNDLLVINKPSGMIVHPGNGVYEHTLVNALLYHFKELSKVNGENRPGIVHRIDKDTSGLLVVAKNDKAHLKLSEQLQDKSLFRVYKAIVHGQLSDRHIIINAPIGRDKNDRTKMAITSNNSKNATTHINVIEVYKDYSYIECKLETGRTHQIRVHLNYIKHPILGDPKYGYKKDDTSYGQYLHAYKIGFIHPSTNEYMEFEIDLPKEFKDKLNDIAYDINNTTI